MTGTILFARGYAHRETAPSFQRKLISFACFHLSLLDLREVDLCPKTMLASRRETTHR